MIFELQKILKDEKVMNYYEKNFEQICAKLGETCGSEENMSIEGIGCALVRSLVKEKAGDKINTRMYLFSFKWLQFYLNSGSGTLLERQTKLCRLQLPEYLCILFCQLNNGSVILASLQLLILLLKDNCKKTQSMLYKLLTQRRELDFFAKLHRMAWTEGDLLVEKAHEAGETMKQDRLVAMSLDEVLEGTGIPNSHSVVTSSVSNVTTYWHFLTLLCGGPYVKMQDLLHQPLNNEGSCFLKLAIRTLGSLSKFVDENNSALLLQVLDFILEMVKGPNPQNQKAILQSKFFDHVKEYMDEYQEFNLIPLNVKALHLEQIIIRSVEIGLCAVEGKSNENSVFIEIGKSVNLVTLVKILTRSLKRLGVNCKGVLRKPNLDKSDMRWSYIDNTGGFGPELTQLFSVFFFMQYMNSSLSADNTLHSHDLSEEDKLTLQWLRLYTGSVEVCFQKQLEKVYFIRLPPTFLLDSEDKRNFLNRAGLSTHMNRMYQLLEQAKEFQFAADYRYSVRFMKGFWPKVMGWLADRTDTTLFVAALVVGIACMFTDNYSVEPFGLADTHPLYFGLKVGLLFLSLMRVVLFLIVHAPLVIGLNRVRKETEKIVLTWTQKLELLLDQPSFLFGVAMLVPAVIAVATTNNFFLSLHLLQLPFCSVTLSNIVRMFVNNSKLIGTIWLLIILIILFLAMVAFFLIPERFFNTIEKEHNCETLMHCFLQFLTLGLRSAGGVGDQFGIPSFSWRRWFFLSLSFDEVFFLSINVFCINILIGAIIDSITDWRLSHQEIKESLQTRCFICNLDRDWFDRKLGGFESHVSEEHNIWDYLGYIYHLKKVPLRGMTGIDKTVAEKLDKNDTAWLPTGRALVLESSGIFCEDKQMIEGLHFVLRNLNQTLGDKIDSK